MTIDSILKALNEVSPNELQESWDNSGFCLGSKEQEIENVYLALDIDSELLENVKENALVITHHPLIFKGLKQIDYDRYPGNLLKTAIMKNISLISMHTHYDKTHLNRYVVEKVLGYEVKSCEEYICYFDVNASFATFARKVADVLKLPNIKVVKSNEFIQTAAITTGAGGSLINYVEQADCFLTGDIKYHEAKEAQENKLSLIDIRHYESELFFAESLKEVLKNFPLNVIIANSKNPFSYIEGTHV